MKEDASGSNAKAVDNAEYTIKLLTLGEASVGKSSLVFRFTDDNFNPKIGLTVGVDFKTKFVDVEGSRVRCQIWDTAGVERFRSITKSYFLGSSGILLVYDVSNRRTFEMVKTWAQNIEQYAGESVYTILVGNKADLVEGRAVSTEEGQALAQELKMGFFETSAKSGLFVQELFQDLISKAFEVLKITRSYAKDEQTQTSLIKLDSTSSKWSVNIKFCGGSQC